MSITYSSTEIDPKSIYVVIDRQTGAVVYKTIYANRRRARAWADRKDLEYGAYRYTAQLASSETILE